MRRGAWRRAGCRRHRRAGRPCGRCGRGNCGSGRRRWAFGIARPRAPRSCTCFSRPRSASISNRLRSSSSACSCSAPHFAVAAASAPAAQRVAREATRQGALEELGVPLAGEKQLQLLHVREQDPRLPASRMHRFPRAGLFGREYALAALCRPYRLELRLVVRAARPRRKPDAAHVAFPLRCLADVHAERNARARQQGAQPHQLILGQGVHRIDDHGADARRCPFVPQPQAATDDRVEEALRLTGAGAGRNERRATPDDRADRLILVPRAARRRSEFAVPGVDGAALRPPGPPQPRHR